ncbi:TIR domain-containing protein [candidate division KSB1 bacterium]|nr:TIR domain-containing protein [candidate division KSB1 bacterium]
MNCPHCNKKLVSVGQFLICLEHGQIAKHDQVKTKRIFISYGRDEHQSLAARLAKDLTKRGHQIWFDRDRLLSGSDGEQCIEQGIDWLTDQTKAGRYFISIKEGKILLTNYCRQQYNSNPSHMSDYVIRQIANHLLDQYRWENLCRLLGDLRFIEAYCKIEQVYDLIDIYHSVYDRLPEAQANVKKTKAIQKQIEKWEHELIAFCQLERKKQANDRSPVKDTVEPPPPVSACRILTGEEFAAENRRLLTHPTRMEQIYLMSRFLESQSYAIYEFGRNPGFIFQTGYNTAPYGFVHDAAQKNIKNLILPILLRKWPPDYSYFPKSALLKTLTGHTGRVLCVALASDASLAVSGGADFLIKIWDLQTGQNIRTLLGHSSFVNCVGLSQDKKTVISAGKDSTIKIWDVLTGECRRTLTGHAGSVQCVTLTWDGGFAVSGGQDKTIRVWDLVQGICTQTIKDIPHEIQKLKLSADGKHVLVLGNDKTFSLWDIKTGECLSTFSGHSLPVNCVRISEDKKFIISASDDKTLRIWDLNGECTKILSGHLAIVNNVVITRKGNIAISASNDKTIKVWDVASGNCIKTLKGHTGWIYMIQLLENQKHLISASDDNTLKLWDIKTGKCLTTFKGHSDFIESVCILRSDKYILSASRDMSIKMWDINNGQNIRTFSGHTGPVDCLEIAGNNRYAISSSSDNTVRLWDIDSGTCLLTEVVYERVTSVLYCEPKTLVIGFASGEIWFYDVANAG